MDWIKNQLFTQNRPRNTKSAAALAGIFVLVLIIFTGACSAGGGTRLAAAPANHGAAAPALVETVAVISRRLNVTAQLPGELLPYEVVGIFPKVTGFVRWMGVDRGSRVK
ncbi:MAG: hypothetical protein ACRD3O_12910, partial [Terriglobia bacterium]